MNALFQPRPTANSAAIQAQNLQSQPWIEKYRPKSMNEVASQEEAVAVLKKTMESQNLPHLLFYGPPGTGKTSSILALARELYGPEMIKARVLELNASDERGIDVIRAKVKDFARVAVGSSKSSEYPCPPYKIIILDEADSMTAEAQSALRRTMETYSKITRFCLICNYVSRIIEPLASRCAKFRFKPLDRVSIKARLDHIAKQENVNCSDEVLDKLVDISDGDMRKSIMYLQSAHRLCRDESTITADIICEIGGVIPQSLVSEMLAVWQPPRNFESAQKTVERAVRSGYSATQLISQLHDQLLKSEHIGDKDKAMMCQRLAQVDRCLVDGADEELQLLQLLTMA
ncbi:P-loop containing nucleoside triphosphate hydrolase protein [Polychytrium aggregatum]|uniref:P-loop containing nucleoside triphosphate hydrolase protein n=1 Tax=Polychytrium aggregatum TaxID=110093 RepID=UPI0022FEEBAD|nr:P-loop containing nucleoside triphosphate hydrolase protein [Polychytrium aggregatum]KAI9209306.1 P-loop containing nucleoside triphosphate hydrolase protein [Polychytrium aggregatum]